MRYFSLSPVLRPGRSRFRRLLAVAAGLALLGGLAAPAGPVTASPAPGGCLTVDLGDANVWGSGANRGGFTLTITITNTCTTTVDGWQVALTLPAEQTVTQGWSAQWAQSGSTATADHLAWNRLIPPGASIRIGINGTWAGNYAPPVGCAVNGGPCDGGPSPSPDPTGTGPAPEPPVVALTRPVPGYNLVVPCDLRFAATATMPGGGEIDRVEFYLDGEPVGSVDAAPYELVVPYPHTGHGQQTALARAYSTDDPPLIGESAEVLYNTSITPPALMVVACTGMRPVEIREGESTAVNFRLNLNDTRSGTASATGPLTVSPASFTLDQYPGHDVVITAPPGSAGSSAMVTVAAPGYISASVAVTILP